MNTLKVILIARDHLQDHVFFYDSEVSRAFKLPQ